MVTKVKYAVAFVLGAMYASGWWGVATPVNPIVKLFSWIVVLFGSIAIIGSIIITLDEHWDEA